MNREITILELFGGISSATQALKNLGYNVFSLPIEIDKKIMNVNNLLHGSNWHSIDIKTIPNNSFICKEKIDVAVVGFPCQDISLAGKQAGMMEGTRSSLLWEAVRILKEVQPNLIIFENVKMFANKKYDWARAELIHEFTELGYRFNNKVLNAKDFGIPQNRERLFMVFRKDAKPILDFPKQKMKPLKDFLEPFSFDMNLINQPSMIKAIEQNKIKVINDIEKDFINTLTVKQDRWNINVINVYKEFENFITIPRAKDEKLINGSYNRLWKDDKYIGTLNVINPIKIAFSKESFKCNNGIITLNKDYEYKLSDGSKRPLGNLNEKNGTTILPLYKNHSSNDIGWKNTSTLTTSCQNKILVETEKDNKDYLPVINIKNKYFICRQITPGESLRLMGWKDEQIDKVIHLPKTTLYKVAGNAIVIPVLEAIFKANLGD